MKDLEKRSLSILDTNTILKQFTTTTKVMLHTFALWILYRNTITHPYYFFEIVNTPHFWKQFTTGVCSAFPLQHLWILDKNTNTHLFYFIDRECSAFLKAINDVETGTLVASASNYKKHKVGVTYPIDLLNLNLADKNFWAMSTSLLLRVYLQEVRKRIHL